MIVGLMFEGDDRRLIKLQAEHYRESLTVLINTVAKCYRAACQIASINIPENEWPTEWGIDLRTIQMAHDRLAAIWRHGVSNPEPALPLANATLPIPGELAAWLNWLRVEIERWVISDPELIRLCVCIFQNQNSDAGYAAETALHGLLGGQHGNIRWL